MAYYLIGGKLDRQSRRAVFENVTQGDTPPLVLFLVSRQLGVPISDTSIGSWTNEAGNTTNLFASIDETVPSDTDYVQSALGPSSDVATFALTSLQNPLSGPQYLRYRYGKDSNDAQINLTVDLLQGVSTVQTWTHTDVPVGFTPVAQLITGSITDPTALSVRFTATQV